jgi:hypothetical protein
MDKLNHLHAVEIVAAPGIPVRDFTPTVHCMHAMCWSLISRRSLPFVCIDEICRTTFPRHFISSTAEGAMKRFCANPLWHFHAAKEVSGSGWSPHPIPVQPVSVMLQYRFAMKRLFDVAARRIHAIPKVNSKSWRMVALAADRHLRARGRSVHHHRDRAGFGQRHQNQQHPEAIPPVAVPGTQH